MGDASEHHVYFAVFDFGDDPKVVTEALGVTPTKAWTKGEAIKHSAHGRQTHSRWVLQSQLPLAAPIDEHFRDLLPRLEQRRIAVMEVCDRFRARLAVAAYLRAANPGFRLDSEVIRRIAALELEVDFDLYFLSDPPVPGSGS
jgi:hypothetical protein